MFRIPTFRLSFVLAVTLAVIVPLLFTAHLAAQDDPDETPLGDVARNLRKKNQPSENVIDNDNLSTVVDEAGRKRASGSMLKFLLAGDRNRSESGPDVTCSLSFTTNTKALLADQYAEMDLPASDIPKLTGPATIEGDALTVSILNETDWHVSELSVALTVIRKTAPAPLPDGLGVPDPLIADGVRPEKKPDLTLIYRMRAAAPPFSTAVFSAPLNLDLAPGEEWHWAVVRARGYPPQNRMEQVQNAMPDHQSGSAALVPAAEKIPQSTPAAFDSPQR